MPKYYKINHLLTTLFIVALVFLFVPTNAKASTSPSQWTDITIGISHTSKSTKKKKSYYYKVRAYKTVNGKKIYGPWSSVKKYKMK